MLKVWQAEILALFLQKELIDQAPVNMLKNWKHSGFSIAQGKTPENEETAQVPDAWSRLSRQSWARLLQKVYEVDPLLCPKCQGTMTVEAIIEDPAELARIIDWANQQERGQSVTVCGRSPPALALASVKYPKTLFMQNRIPPRNRRFSAFGARAEFRPKTAKFRNDSSYQFLF